MKTTLISQELQPMKMFVTFAAALPMHAAVLPMFVSVGAVLASRNSPSRLRNHA